MEILRGYPLKTEERDNQSEVEIRVPKNYKPEIIITESFSK
ncbi:hypothetical protein BMS3Abin04_00902 [bacterium BMS3Abin04]|nr:hypothetical protein BMS3Abin04_00902 [bacterium BMS3Abin04]